MKFNESFFLTEKGEYSTIWSSMLRSMDINGKFVASTSDNRQE